MDKPADIIMQFEKSNLTTAFWFGIIDLAEKKTEYEVDGVILVVIRVKSFSMLDHQFIQFKADLENGKEVQVWIPRNLVLAILETESDVDSAFSFVNKAVK